MCRPDLAATVAFFHAVRVKCAFVEWHEHENSVHRMFKIVTAHLSGYCA